MAVDPGAAVLSQKATVALVSHSVEVFELKLVGTTSLDAVVLVLFESLAALFVMAVTGLEDVEFTVEVPFVP